MTKRKRISKLGKYIVFSFTMVIIMTIVVLTLQTIHPEIDYSTYYITFSGIFGGVETLGCAIIKCFNIKKESENYG